MGLYRRYLLPRILDKMASGPEADRYRKQVLAPARGRVLEVGFGTGLNAPHYPATVEKVIGVDPAEGGGKLRAPRIAAAPVPIEFQLGSAEALRFADGSFDTVVSTLSLCTIADPRRALAELRRVLAPGGQFLFLEHGLNSDPSIQKWQHRLNGLNRLIAGGCNVNRDIKGLIEGAGFSFTKLEQFNYPNLPRYASFTSLGTAVTARLSRHSSRNQ